MRGDLASSSSTTMRRKRGNSTFKVSQVLSSNGEGHPHKEVMPTLAKTATIVSMLTPGVDEEGPLTKMEACTTFKVI